ncbi:sulfatase-like hydrolase/transferase [Lentisphaera profundi]|uniref:Sulfatase-like hydrolase/transferase n=1 Tax=Lentisphaera profundi TaxID=1658616 RepID=A0ABY7VTD9_9BACT|nr:sulfatase-like hydrolase/transferase [Lentisphaera profundi]WDE96490.1 sulfatase-like hydrolase/transferase [Lentisphaera profundi]
MKINSIILTALAGFASTLTPLAKAADKKPNIVLILADDVGADMFSSYGQSHSAQTPNIDKIGADGVQFKTCFAPAICGPSRALIMTGVYANRTGAFRNDMWAFDSRGTLFTKQHSWAKLLSEGGYKTAVAGKWHCSAREPYEQEVGFDEYCIYEGPDKIKQHFDIDVVAQGRRKDVKLADNRYWYPSTVQNGKYLDATEKDFGPDQRCEFIMDFMERKAKNNQPFMAYWPIVIPHGPYSTTPDNGLAMDIELKKPDVKGMSKEDKERILGEYSKKQKQRFVNLIQYMDKLVGKVVQKAKDLDIYDNTYFIFCADNGTASTAKDRAVERGVHVPFLVCGPGVKQRGMSEELTDFSDVAPTLLEMAGVPFPKDVPFDGKSQVSFLTGKSDTHREWIYAYTGPVQIFRTKTHLLEARSALYGKPDGRLYYTADKRFGEAYKRVDNNPEHSTAKKKFQDLITQLPNHLEPDHPFFSSKYGKKWTANNSIEELARKQLYNHPDYRIYDEED